MSLYKLKTVVKESTEAVKRLQEDSTTPGAKRKRSEEDDVSEMPPLESFDEEDYLEEKKRQENAKYVVACSQDGTFVTLLTKIC